MSEICFGEEDLLAMEKQQRTLFVNSLSGFKNVALIGTQNAKGQTNLAIFNSVMHIGANPALFGILVRPNSVERHTLENIVETGAFTINYIYPEIYKKAHQTSARYPREQSEFDAVGLNTYYSNRIIAPYVQESRVKYGLKFAEKHLLAINNTVLVIGQIVEVILPSVCLQEDGFINLELAETLACCGLDSYHLTKQYGRLPYAKP